MLGLLTSSHAQAGAQARTQGPYSCREGSSPPRPHGMSDMVRHMPACMTLLSSCRSPHVLYLAAAWQGVRGRDLALCMETVRATLL